MTTRALLFSPEGHRDWEVTRESLRKRAIQQEFTVAGEVFYLVVEPLIKKSGDGKLMQTIRVRSASNKSVKDLLGKPVVSASGGGVITQGGEDAPKGHLGHLFGYRKRGAIVARCVGDPVIITTDCKHVSIHP